MVNKPPLGPIKRLDLIQAVAEKAGVTTAKAEIAVSTMFATIEAGLREQREIRVSGFGAFEVATRKASIGRNPRTGEALQVAASRSVRFRPGKALKALVQNTGG